MYLKKKSSPTSQHIFWFHFYCWAFWSKQFNFNIIRWASVELKSLLPTQFESNEVRFVLLSNSMKTWVSLYANAKPVVYDFNFSIDSNCNNFVFLTQKSILFHLELRWKNEWKVKTAIFCFIFSLRRPGKWYYRISFNERNNVLQSLSY